LKIAVQLGLLPGKTVSDQAKWGQDNGAEGIELGVWGGVDKMKQEAEEINGVLPVTSVCGNMNSDGDRGFDFVHPDPELRRKSIEGSKAVLKFCGEVAAVGQIVPPIFGPPMVPDLSPVISIPELEDELMVAACKAVGPFAAAHNTLFMLEPLNRYEQHYLRKQSDGVRIIKKAKVKGIGLISDFFHMHIEETSITGTLREIGKYTNHMHLADNTRMEPGTGDIDFVAAFKALHEVGFKGYMAYECGITGNTAKQKAENLAKSISYLRDCIKKAQK